MKTIKRLTAEFRQQFDRSDAWGSAMQAWFAVAEELHLRGALIPEHWKFRPPLGLNAHDPDSWFGNESAARASTDALIRLGNILERYTRMLDRKGEL